jgi:hypothetical protein
LAHMKGTRRRTVRLARAKDRERMGVEVRAGEPRFTSMREDQADTASAYKSGSTTRVQTPRRQRRHRARYR